MTPKPTLVPLALCEQCWLEEHVHWEPESIDESGSVLVRMSGVDIPEMIKEGSVEICCMCGSVTVAGIYVMADPKEVYFAEEDSSSHDFEFDLSGAEDDE